MISQSHLVESHFGYWPDFADAKIVEFSWAKSGSLCLALHYIDAEQPKNATVWLQFSGVSELDLSELRSENVLDSLRLTCGEPMLVELEPCYGLGGSFRCSAVKVTKVASN